MELTGRVRILEVGGCGVWRVGANLADLQHLGKPMSRSSGRSILGLNDYKVSDDLEYLTFPIEKVDVLVLGEADECIAVSALEETPETNEDQRDRVTNAPPSISASASTEEQLFRSGDHAFIEACKSELLPDDVVELGQNFLASIREFSEDELREGKHRKWVTYPKNFLALTIQNRNKQFCVHVKKTSSLDGLSDTLDIRDDRPGYVRFWLQNRSQLAAAITAARASFGV